MSFIRHPEAELWSAELCYYWMCELDYYWILICTVTVYNPSNIFWKKDTKWHHGILGLVISNSAKMLFLSLSIILKDLDIVSVEREKWKQSGSRCIVAMVTRWVTWYSVKGNGNKPGFIFTKTDTSYGDNKSSFRVTDDNFEVIQRNYLTPGLHYSISHSNLWNLYFLLKGHLSWSFYFLNVLGIVNSHIINYIFVLISSDLWNKMDI